MHGIWTKRSARNRFGLMSACLAALLTLSGCNSLPAKPRPVATPPAQYTEATPEPKAETPWTNGGLARGYQSMRVALRSCNLDKSAVKLWSDLQKGIE